MKKSTSSGSDSINAIVLMDIYPSIKRTLLHLVNLSLCSGIFPSVLKNTKITPIQKPGKNSLEASSYRPVSNTCSIGKIIERCVFKQILDHINNLQLINENHHGGVKHHSTTTCVLQLLNDANNELEMNKKTALMAVDLSSAYDLVDHKLLLEKCRLLSIGEVCLKWIEGFLSNRSQFVELGGIKSSTLKCGPEGVVQGGPSSGELFVIFLNTLPIASLPATKRPVEANASSNQFVDDLNSVISGTNEEELNVNIQNEFLRIHNYLVSHKMQINSSKTQLMYLNPSKSQELNPLVIDKYKIKHQDNMKVLGITISANLKWDDHIKNGSNNMVKRLNAKNAMLRSLQNQIPFKALSMTANNLINSTIIYGAPIWAGTSCGNKDILQK